MVPDRMDVSRVVWPRDRRRVDPTPELRRAALVQASVLGLVGVWLRFGWGHASVALLVWGLAAAALLTGLLRPVRFAPMHRFGRLLARYVGAALTWLLLAPLYVAGFGLVALYLRLRGADPMQRRTLPAGLSYWVPRRRTAETGDYSKQFRVEDRGVRAEQRPLDLGGPEARP